MFNSNQKRHLELLQRRYDRLESKYKELQLENKELENALGICKEKVDYAEKAKEELDKLIHDTIEIKAKYEKALNDLAVIRKKYTSDIKGLIRIIK